MNVSIAAARKNVGLTQRQAAHRLGISVGRLSRYEMAHSTIPYDILELMCGLYRCGLDDLRLPLVKGGEWNCEDHLESCAN